MKIRAKNSRKQDLDEKKQKRKPEYVLLMLIIITQTRITSSEVKKQRKQRYRGTTGLEESTFSRVKGNKWCFFFLFFLFLFVIINFFYDSCFPLLFTPFLPSWSTLLYSLLPLQSITVWLASYSFFSNNKVFLKWYSFMSYLTWSKNIQRNWWAVSESTWDNR